MSIDPILPPERIRQMKQAGFWGERILLDDLDHWTATVPDRIAIIDHNSMTGERTELSYAAFADRVDRIAAGLHRLGIRKGDVVSLQLPNWWMFNALHFAALRIGAVTNPIMPIFRERELGFMLQMAESKLLVIPREFRGFAYQPMAAALRPALPALQHVLVVGGEGDAAFDRLYRDTPPPDPAMRAHFAAARPSADDVV
ncbi:MAG TPA: AMP-binding protein, partial [Acetobacteraceae bacterium]|nr:AMP-binding protein [Acetobacteraceae bacterium]